MRLVPLDKEPLLTSITSSHNSDSNQEGGGVGEGKVVLCVGC